MSDEEFDLAAPELTPDDFLILPEDRFTTGNVALVTGAASGIGQATAVVLAANGLAVVGTDMDEEGLAETAAIAEDCDVPGRFTHVVGNLTDDDDIERIVAAAADEGELRYLANIAGLQHIAPIPEFPPERYDLLHDVMLRAPFMLAKYTMPHIRATDDGVGAIGNMSSIHGQYATKDKAAYITMKHGLTGLTRSIAAEGEGMLRGFSVSAGYVLTPLMVDQIEDTARERGISEREVVEDVMLGQARTKTMMAPVDVANLFAFGFSGFGRHLNGADLLWDGGYVHTYE
jgi:3-hydroxybutyrate dehydrogenase